MRDMEAEMSWVQDNPCTACKYNLCPCQQCLPCPLRTPRVSAAEDAQAPSREGSRGGKVLAEVPSLASSSLSSIVASSKLQKMRVYLLIRFSYHLQVPQLCDCANTPFYIDAAVLYMNWTSKG